MKIKTKQIIDVQEWDKTVKETYGRHYSFQQQDGCQPRGNFYITVPDEEAEDFEQDSVLEKVNGSVRGVSFKAWLARDPEQKLSNPEEQDSYCLKLWWARNFYPNIQVVANDLHTRGLLPAGEYTINIDW